MTLTQASSLSDLSADTDIFVRHDEHSQRLPFCFSSWCLLISLSPCSPNKIFFLVKCPCGTSEEEEGNAS